MNASTVLHNGVTLDLVIERMYTRATKGKIKIRNFDIENELSRNDLKAIAKLAAQEWSTVEVDYDSMNWNSKEQTFTVNNTNAPQISVRIHKEGYHAEAAARQLAFEAKWAAVAAREEFLESSALAEAKRIMEVHAELRITELEVEIEGNVFQVTRSLSWANQDTDRFQVRAMTRFSTKPVYPTNAERATLAAFDTTVMV